MNKISQLNDVETSRYQKNRTDTQKRSVELTREGVVVNSFVKEPNVNLNDLRDSLIISENVKLPDEINNNKQKNAQSLLPLALVSIGTMATVAFLSLFIKKNAQNNLVIKPEKRLQNLTRNLTINEETHQAIYQMVQCPNQKTILAGIGVLTLSVMAFIGKFFIDGFKEVWVKKQEAKIQKDLQENLINVEAQTFSGKIQITRNMLSNYAKEFTKYLCNNSDEKVFFDITKKQPNITFKGTETQKHPEKKREDNQLLIALGTIAGIVGFGFYSLRNLSKSKGYLEDYIGNITKKIETIVASSSNNTKETDKINLENMLQAIDANKTTINQKLSKLNWGTKEKEEFIENVISKTQKATATVDKAIGGDGTPKPAFSSFINDYRAFFYNWLLDTSNPLFRNLFLGITGLTAISYGGKSLGEAIKEVQVKRINANTELELQKKLVSTELRNFKTKKDSAIEPLCEEFYAQAKNDKDKSGLKTIADNILFEIKNGPPFVYS